jgi:lysophospholipase L1-like esterase
VSNYVFNGDKIDAMGKSYPVKLQTNNDGFRIFGNPQENNKKKVLFLGDSFTQAVEVSNSKTYYGILSDTLPIEVFAFGVGGYGTLQEYMILDKYIDEIRPDIIVIQFCSNDFVNNHYELELRSNMNNNAMRRPYLTKNGIIYRSPKNFSAIRDVANKHSRIFYFIISRIDRLLKKVLHTNSVEDVIEEKGVSYPFFRESVEITGQLVKKIRLRIPSATPVYAFSSDDSNPYYDEFKRISKNNVIYFIDGIPQSIRDAEQEGITTRAADHAHWNETGHQIVANALKHYFEANW